MPENKRTKNVESTPDEEPGPSNVKKKPTIAYVLTMVGGTIILLFSIASVLLFTVGISLIVHLATTNSSTSTTNSLEQTCQAAGLNMTGNLTSDFSTCLSGIAPYYLLGAISGGVVLVAGIRMNSFDVKRVKNMAAVALIFSLVSLIAGGGLWIGFVFGTIGSIMGLIYKG